MSELAEVQGRELVTVASVASVAAVAGIGRVVRRATTAFDLVAFGRALQERDFGYQHTCYALEADIRLLGPDHDPALPRIVRGSGAVKAWLTGFGGRDLVVTHLVDGGDRVAFTQRWHLGVGADLVATSTAELSDDRICTQHTLLAWDRHPPKYSPATVAWTA